MLFASQVIWFFRIELAGYWQAGDGLQPCRFRDVEIRFDVNSLASAL